MKDIIINSLYITDSGKEHPKFIFDSQKRQSSHGELIIDAHLMILGLQPSQKYQVEFRVSNPETEEIGNVVIHELHVTNEDTTWLKLNEKEYPAVEIVIPIFIASQLQQQNFLQLSVKIKEESQSILFFINNGDVI